MTNETELENLPQLAPSNEAHDSGGHALTPFLMTALIESAGDAIISKTLEGTITSWNRGAERIFGYTASEIIGQSILQLIPLDRHTEEPGIIARIQAGERIEHYETIRQRKDGTLIEISLTVSPIHGPEGQVIGASKIARDITVLKQTQRQLNFSEAQYRTLFNSIDDGFCVIEVLFDAMGRAFDYRFLEINPAFERQSGLVNAQGKTMRDYVPNHAGERFEIYGQVALTGEPIRFESGDEQLGRWFDIYAFRVDDPAKHKVAVLFTNIQERKQAEAERDRLLQNLEFERQRLSAIFHKAPAFVAVLRGPQHIFELANPSYYQLVGHRDVIGKPLAVALSEIEGQGYMELLDGVFQSGQPYEGREMPAKLQREPNGPLEERYIDLLLHPLLETDGTVSGILVHGVDITEQVRARQSAEEAKRSAEQARQHAEAANRTKDEFLATLSHELRTPLTAIMGWTSILQSGQISAQEAERGLLTIERNARAQAQLIDDILDVSRVITGKMRLQVQPVDLAPIVEEAVNTVLPSAQAKQVRLQRVLDAGASIVSGDSARLLQIVWNLLSNAIKFTPKDGKVQIRLEQVNSHLEVTIVDTGQGIAPEVLPHVFDRFRQADSSSTRSHGGLGLGLSIVRHLAEMHGGSVDAYSEGLGKGATFTLKLPLVAVRSLPRGPEERRVHPRTSGNLEKTTAPRLDGLHILIVDDQEDTRIFLALVMEKCGAQVTSVASASEAFAALQELRPDVLLSDIGMPDEDGYSLIKRVRALSPEAGGLTPAAALTAFARVEDRVRVLRSGFQSHLPKPIDPVELASVVAALAGRHDAP